MLAVKRQHFKLQSLNCHLRRHPLIVFTYNHGQGYK